MKILYVGTLKPSGTCHSRFKALKKLESDVHGFDVDQFFDWDCTGHLLRGFEAFFLESPRFSRANQALLAA